MFTVLIAKKEHIDAIRRDNKLFFEPFLENKELAFCYWNPSGQNLRDSVPGLSDTIGRRKEWRAVIINSASDEQLKSRNPFDVVDYSGIKSLVTPNAQPNENEDWDKWETEWKAYYENLAAGKEAVYKSALEYPLQKLATWLCYKPEDYILNDVKEKQDVYDWAMEKIGRDELKASAKLEIMERDLYKKGQRIKEMLRRNFIGENHLNIAYPSEVHCITTRTAENSFFDPDSYWNIYRESEYSTFADRNMYFDKMRFMLFDLLPETHCNFRTDYVRFLASVLVFASNPVPSGAMQARYLYKLETDTDDTPLCVLVTSYDKKLAATSEVIDNEMEKIRSEIPSELSDKAAEALFCTPTDVAVKLDESCDPENVTAENNYGLFFDVPEDENHKWNRDYLKSKKEIEYIVKQRSRSLKKSVGQLNSTCEISDVNISRLTPAQIDDIREYTDTSEDEMISLSPQNFSDVTRFDEEIAQKSDSVKKEINQRMTRKTVFVLSSICLGLFLVCFAPFLLKNGNSTDKMMTAIILSASMLALIVVIMLISLFVLRKPVRNAVKFYNRTVHDIMDEIQSSLKQYSKYLSAVCNVRRGYAIQNYAEKNLDEYTKSLRIRKKHQEDIRKIRAGLKERYMDYFGGNAVCDEFMSKPYDYDFDQHVEYPYPAPFLAGDCRQIEFINSGNYVTVPSSYVKSILIRVEGIYEK